MRQTVARRREQDKNARRIVEGDLFLVRDPLHNSGIENVTALQLEQLTIQDIDHGWRADLCRGGA